MIQPDLPADLVLERLAASGLRGRGGGWYEAARKWRAVRVEGGAPVVIANGAESEPGSFKDRYVVQRRPADAARRPGARRPGRRRERGDRVPQALVRGPGPALEHALGEFPLPGLSVRIVRGDDGYVAGEETAAPRVTRGTAGLAAAQAPASRRRRLSRPANPRPQRRDARASAGGDGRSGGFRRGETTLRDGLGRRACGRGSTSCRSARLFVEVIRHAGGRFGGDRARLPGRSRRPSAPGARARLAARPGRRCETRARRSERLPCSSSGHRPARSRWRRLVAAFFEREACGQCPPCTVGSASLARIVRGLEAGASRTARPA